jgi:hypothetical protein
MGDLMLLRGRRVMTTIIERAAARGEIEANHDRSLIADVPTAMSMMRVLNGHTVDAAFVREVIDTLVLPALGGPGSPRPAQSDAGTATGRPRGTGAVKSC